MYPFDNARCIIGVNYSSATHVQRLILLRNDIQTFEII